MPPGSASTPQPTRARATAATRRPEPRRAARRTTPQMLAPAAAPRLPGLAAVEPAISVPPLAQVRLARLCEMLTHLGVLSCQDWGEEGDTPSDFLQNAATRWTRLLRRDAPDALSVQLTVHDWNDLLAHTHTEPRPRENERNRMVVSIHSATCPVIAMRSIVKTVGPRRRGARAAGPSDGAGGRGCGPRPRKPGMGRPGLVPAHHGSRRGRARVRDGAGPLRRV